MNPQSEVLKENVALSSFISNECILVNCKNCGEQFVAKYWDSEIDWYIDLNTTGYCSKCNPESYSA